MTTLVAVLGLALVYLGAFNTVLALNVETCTNDAADSLLGGIYSIALYSMGFGILYLVRPHKLAFLALIPVAIVAWEQFCFTGRLATGYLLKGMSACEAMFGGQYGLDGREASFAIMWIALNIVFGIGIAASFYRVARHPESRS